MFTGIVETVGRVAGVAPEGSSRRLILATGFGNLDLGESVAVNGVCLTVTHRDDAGNADFFVSPESLDRSNLGALAAGSAVNLERAATLATRLSGHLVQGHVDGKARLTGVVADGEARRIELSLPKNLRLYCVEKGSITLDGISLTLNAVGEPNDRGRFAAAITLIPHTWDHTNLRHRALGDEINVEVDVMAKYVEQLCRAYLSPSNA